MGIQKIYVVERKNQVKAPFLRHKEQNIHADHHGGKNQ
jgi:hypothetical protein